MRSVVLVNPLPEIPDEVRVAELDLPAKLRSALIAAGFATAGEIREAPDERLLQIEGIGKGSVDLLRRTLGLPSTQGVRPISQPGHNESL